MKKYLLAGGLFLALGLAAVSCSDDEPDVPRIQVKNLTFTDIDGDAHKMGGTLSWELPDNTGGITGFAIYTSEDGSTKQTKLGESRPTSTYGTIVNGTDYAPYLMVVAKNSGGEALQGAVVAVTDSVILWEPAFTDTDKRVGRIGGELTWMEPLETDGIEAYVVYGSNDGQEREVRLGEAPFGTNRFDVEAGTGFYPYLVIVARTTTGEAPEALGNVSVHDTHTGFYVLHSGDWGSNNSTLASYTYDPVTYTPDVFAAVNGKGLGDTANDLVVYGSKRYVTVTESNVIYVLDSDGSILREIQPAEGGQPEKPRYAAPYEGKVYVSLYSGYVACIDTTSLQVERRIQVGAYPEQLTAAGGKLYVANSNYGTGTTVSVIDLRSFSRQDIEVTVNPTEIAADAAGNVYVISMGNYGAIPNTLQKIDPATNEVSVITNATEMAVGPDKVYLMYSQYDADWKQTISFFTYDPATGTVDRSSFITDGTSIAKPYKLSVFPTTGEIAITESDFRNTGTLYLFDAAGRLSRKIADTRALNPIKVCYY